MSGLLPLFQEQRVEATSWPDRPRYLMSYAYADDDQVALAQDNNVDLIVDSGAFTVANSGGTVDHDAYLEWLVGHASAITFALSLDVIGDYRASRVNHELAVEAVGDKVHMVPAWHFGSPEHELERMCKAYSFVCIGGAVPFAKQPKALFRAAAQAHRIAATHGTRLHGLGMTGNRILHGLPWYSVDSSAWLSSVRFPSMPLANQDGRIEQFEHGRPLDPVARQLVLQYGGDPDIVATPGWSLKAHVGDGIARERRRWSVQNGARAFMYLEAAKAVHQPQHPILVYLSGNYGGYEGGAVQVLIDAHAMRNPWTTTPERHPGMDATEQDALQRRQNEVKV